MQNCSHEIGILRSGNFRTGGALRRVPVLIAGIMFFSLTAAFSSRAAIGSLRLDVTGEIRPGTMVNNDNVEVETKSTKYEVESWTLDGLGLQWDRREAPVLTVHLIFDADTEIPSKALKSLTLTGDFHGAYLSHSWLSNSSDSEDSEDSVVSEPELDLSIKLDPLSTMGAGVQADREKWMEEHSSMTDKLKARYLQTMVFPGWYHDINGWWYMKEDGSWETSCMFQDPKDGSTYCLDQNGYANLNGWLKFGGYWYYADADGRILKDTVTPDHYRVNADGMWVDSETGIPVPCSTGAGSGTDNTQTAVGGAAQ